MTSIIDNDILLALVEAYEAQTERLRNRRLGSTKKLVIAERERVASVARAALPGSADDEASYHHFNRYIAGDR